MPSIDILLFIYEYFKKHKSNLFYFRFRMNDEVTLIAAKGQSISKCLFDIFNSPKKPSKKSTLLL